MFISFFATELRRLYCQLPTFVTESVTGEYMNEKLIKRLKAKDPSLTSLDLTMSYIGDKGVRVLGEGLTQNNTLTSLKLNWNKIGDEGARVLCEVLMQNNTLTSLALWMNGIGDEGARVLSRAIINHALIRLDLSDNMIGKRGKKSLATIAGKLCENIVIHYMMGHLSYLKYGEITHAKEALDALGLGATRLPDEPLPSEKHPFFHTLLTDLTQASSQNAYTSIVLPFSYAMEIDLLRLFFLVSSSDDTLWLSKEGFYFSLTGNIDHKTMERPYLCPERNIFFDPESEIEPDQDWVNRLSYALESLIERLGFLPHLSFQYSGLKSNDLRDLLTYLATDPPIEHLDLSHNPIMLKEWNKSKTQKVITRNSVFSRS